jgi:NADH-quinone oxidoreductase subunit D
MGRTHPGVTGNMSLELTVCGDEVVDLHHATWGYLHRGFEKLMERKALLPVLPHCLPHCRTGAGLQRIPL